MLPEAFSYFKDYTSIASINDLIIVFIIWGSAILVSLGKTDMMCRCSHECRNVQDKTFQVTETSNFHSKTPFSSHHLFLQLCLTLFKNNK